MTELVTLLRRYGRELAVCAHAADEIERMQALNSSLTDKANSYIIDNARLAEENERLRAALALAALALAVQAMRAPLDDWKGEVERKALDAARAALEKP